VEEGTLPAEDTAADAVMQPIADVADLQHGAAAAAQFMPRQHAVGRLMRQRMVHPMAADTASHSC